jgi:hypothetical protein
VRAYQSEVFIGISTLQCDPWSLGMLTLSDMRLPYDSSVRSWLREQDY